MLRSFRFNASWDATRAANADYVTNNTYPIWLLKLFVALMGFRLSKNCWGDWEFYDRSES